MVKKLVMKHGAPRSAISQTRLEARSELLKFILQLVIILV